MSIIMEYFTMNKDLLHGKSFRHLDTKEYLNYPSLILREVKRCKLLSANTKHCWELLYHTSKFDTKRFIDNSIKKIKSILSDFKSYRTIQRYLAQLAEHDFITIRKNFDSYGRIENTYSVKVPTSITNKLSESTTKVFIKSNNPVSNPVNPRYDSFVQGNKELNIINNNCYPLEKDEKESHHEKLSTSDIEPEISPDAEVLEYFPAKE